MATGGTPSGKSDIFDIHTSRGGGGGYKYDPSIYAGPFSQMLQAEDAIYRQSKNEREEKAFTLAQAREERAQAREIKKQEQDDHVDFTLDKISNKLGRPDSLKFQDHYEELMGDPDIHKARLTKEGRLAVDSMMKELHDQHQDYVQSWKHIGSNYGWEGNPYDLPTKQNGVIDWDNSLKNHFKPAQVRRDAIEMQKLIASSKQAGELGYGLIQMPDGTTKLVKKEDVFAGKKPAEEPSTSLPSQEPSATTERPPLDSFQTQ